MKNKLILAAPTAKIQIGNQLTATLDTATQNGKKSFQINILTQDDTITKEIENVVEEIKDEVAQSVGNEINDSKNEFFESQVELERVREHSFQNKIGVFIPIIAILAAFGYAAFRSFQNRKWKEALLNKGFNADEIQKLVKSNGFLDEKLKENDVEGYEKRKTLKYAIIFGSFGLAILIGTVMEEAGYFFGFLFLFLGSGFWYYNNKTR